MNVKTMAAQIAEQIMEATEQELKLMLDHFGIDLSNPEAYDGPPFEIEFQDEERHRHFYVNDEIALSIWTAVNYKNYSVGVHVVRHYEGE